ncbi:hypothetical protein MEG_00799 [Bartonella tamiae Th307]|uniref:Uncharacterized protein n=1 Tax=Bartonella tamiae Th239 TaxID=1094558 RepID=J1JZW6_9HYPH|nr:hypothetical protein ME5_01083 [Bartonella tamiae Th239]EJF93941.1 hypothetical protein MEG_00799 [Bartonella tamiae Th307]
MPKSRPCIVELLLMVSLLLLLISIRVALRASILPKLFIVFYLFVLDKNTMDTLFILL